MREFLAVSIVLGSLSLVAQAQSGLGMIQPDAGFVVGIEWRKIVDSPVGGLLTDQLKKAQLPPIPGIQAVQESLLHDLDSVVIAAPAGGLNKNTTDPPVLVVVKGRFNVAQLRGLIPAGGPSVEKYRSVDLISPPDSAPAAGAKAEPNKNRIAFVDQNTILAGDVREVRAAIDRLKGGRLTSATGGILDGVAELASKNDLWIVFELPKDALKEAPPMAVQMFSGVKSAELGMSFGQEFALRLNVRTKDDASATSFAQALQGLIAMGAMSQSESPQAAEMLRKIQVTSDSSRVKLALALDRSELEKMIKEAQAPKTQAPKTQPSKSPVARAPEPTGPKKIHITGLDNGPSELPLAEARK